jgi:hypothetical protein
MKQRFLAAGCVAGMVAASLFAVAAPAQAACTNPVGAAMHLFQNRNGTKDWYPARSSDADLHQTPGSGNFNDKASRARNDYSCNAWVLYDDVNYADRRYCIRPGQNIDLHDSRWNFGDKISSIRKLGNGSCIGYPIFG